MRFRSLREAGFAAIGTTTRIAAAMAAVAIVVAVNQVSKPTPRVLGERITRCAIDDAPVALGSRTLRADRLSVSVRDGRPVSVLVPPLKFTPGTVEIAQPATIAIGVRGAKPGIMTATVVVENPSSCPIAVDSARVSARRGSASAVVMPVAFGGRKRVVLEPGGRATGRASIPASEDGIWSVDATASADVGASA